ncbi:MAG TPA: type IV pilin protein [Usitatibacter sp.]|nr:type IV pilin protein [Usitatibacter sp.]
MQRSKQGFTLVELMFVVAVIGILVAIAIPAYTSAVVKTNRSAAESALMDIAQRQQQYLLDNRSYAPDVATLNLTLPTNVTDFYTVAIAPAAGPPPGFTVTATPIAGGKQAADGPLSIDQAGAKTPVGKW